MSVRRVSVGSSVPWSTLIIAVCSQTNCWRDIDFCDISNGKWMAGVYWFGGGWGLIKNKLIVSRALIEVYKTSKISLLRFSPCAPRNTVSRMTGVQQKYLDDFEKLLILKKFYANICPFYFAINTIGIIFKTIYTIQL